MNERTNEGTGELEMNAGTHSQWQHLLQDHWHQHGLVNRSAQEAKLSIARLLSEPNIKAKGNWLLLEESSPQTTVAGCVILSSLPNSL